MKTGISLWTPRNHVFRNKWFGKIIYRQNEKSCQILFSYGKFGRVFYGSLDTCEIKNNFNYIALQTMRKQYLFIETICEFTAIFYWNPQMNAVNLDSMITIYKGLYHYIPKTMSPISCGFGIVRVIIAMNPCIRLSPELLLSFIRFNHPLDCCDVIFLSYFQFRLILNSWDLIKFSSFKIPR